MKGFFLIHSSGVKLFCLSLGVLRFLVMDLVLLLDLLFLGVNDPCLFSILLSTQENCLDNREVATIRFLSGSST